MDAEILDAFFAHCGRYCGAAFLVDSFVAHSGIRRLACGAMGTALLTRSICNRQFRDLIRTSDGAHVIEFDKTVHIQAPVEDVFAVWSDCREFPCFMALERNAGPGKRKIALGGARARRYAGVVGCGDCGVDAEQNDRMAQHTGLTCGGG